jgi:hypothetical protein
MANARAFTQPALVDCAPTASDERTVIQPTPARSIATAAHAPPGAAARPRMATANSSIAMTTLASTEKVRRARGNSSVPATAPKPMNVSSSPYWVALSPISLRATSGSSAHRALANVKKATARISTAFMAGASAT